jgi:hypothetical protein
MYIPVQIELLLNKRLTQYAPVSYLDCIFGFNCVWKCKLFSNVGILQLFDAFSKKKKHYLMHLLYVLIDI